MVSFASSQYWLQYFVPLATRQLHAGCSHFTVFSRMRIPPSTQTRILRSRLTESSELPLVFCLSTIRRHSTKATAIRPRCIGSG